MPHTKDDVLFSYADEGLVLESADKSRDFPTRDAGRYERYACRLRVASTRRATLRPAFDSGTFRSMKLVDIPFQTIDWGSIDSTNHPGETGAATWRTVEVGNVRIRRVDYSSGYVADHWCERGHVVHVLEGEMVTELRDGRSFASKAGQTYVVADGDGAHRSRSAAGVRLLIVD